jgi:hypothetical protein
VTSKGPNVFDLTVGPVPVVKLEVRLPPGRSGSFKIGFRNASDPGAPVIDPSTQLTYGAPTDPSTIWPLIPGATGSWYGRIFARQAPVWARWICFTPHWRSRRARR